MGKFIYKNPITQGRDMSLRDCHIIKVGKTYYMTGTCQPIWEGPNPGIKLYSSNDLLNWKFEKFLIKRDDLPENIWCKDRFWAPEIHCKNNKYYLSFNCRNDIKGIKEGVNHNCGLAVADDILGPYKILTYDTPLGKGFKNDVSLFTDDDGKSYAYCSGAGIWQAPIDIEKGKLLWDDFKMVFSPRDSGNPDWMLDGIEGPFVVKRDNNYYMFISGWTRGYEIGYATAKNPLGPWELYKGNPIFGTRNREFRDEQLKSSGLDYLIFEDTKDPYCEVGHNSIFTGPDGKDWLCCHYFLIGKKKIINTKNNVEYEDTFPQLGFEPIEIKDGIIKISGPTWTEQIVEW
jgi:beta-xylosidase